MQHSDLTSHPKQQGKTSDDDRAEKSQEGKMDVLRDNNNWKRKKIV